MICIAASLIVIGLIPSKRLSVEVGDHAGWLVLSKRPCFLSLSSDVERNLPLK